MRKIVTVLLSALLFLLAACNRSRPGADVGKAGTAPSPRIIGQSADLDSATPPEYLADIFFDYDKVEIRPDQKEKLARNAEILRKHPTMRIVIEGHIDERHTKEYALALGERMAIAAKDYLVAIGVDSARIQTMAYGKERPFNARHDEAAWAENRRAHFVVIAK